jgi:phosphate transport system substrate-binding protein
MWLNKITRAVCGLLLLCLAACQPVQTASQPTLQVVTLNSPPSLAAWRKVIGACSIKIPGIGLVVNEVPAGQPGLSQADLSLRLDSAPDPALPYRAVIGRDAVIIIVQADNPVQALTLAELRALFNNKVPSWNSLLASQGNPATLAAPLQVWTYPAGDDLRAFFDRAINPVADQGTAPDPTAMLQAVSENPGAVGFVLKSSLAQAPKTIRSVTLAADAQAVLQIPIISALKAEPQGLLRQLILCSQASQP